MVDLPPNVRIYRTTDKEDPVIITDHSNAILCDRGGIHVEQRQSLVTIPRGHDNYAVYQPGTHIHRWNITPKIDGIATPRLAQMIPRDIPGIEENFPSIVSATVIARARYDEVSRLYLTQMSEYEQKADDALRGPNQRIQAAREEAARRIGELEREMEAAIAKITRPTLDLEGLLK